MTSELITAVPRPAAELFPRLRALVEAGTTEYAESTMKVPVANYRDPAVLQAELTHVFAAVPLPLVPAAQVRVAGAFETRTLPDGRSVIVSRGKDGIARVLVNACRHRGAQVAEGSGCASLFVCSYHAWTYDSTGALNSQPGKAGFADVPTSELGLTELASEEAFGIIWYLPEGAPSVADHLGPFAEQLGSYDYGSWTAHPTIEAPLTANWKCAIEAFYETYHFAFVHKNSMVGTGSISNVTTFDAFGRHARLGVPPQAIKMVPAEFTGSEFEMVVVIFFVYPNLVIANSLLGCEYIEATPTGTPGASVLRHTFLEKTDPASVGQRSREEYLAAIRAVITDEDAPAISSSGKGLASAAHEFVLLGRNEPGCQHIHRTLAAALAEAGS